MKDILTFDASTARRTDENGYLHVSGNRITKAVVNPYYGHEIPGWEEAGLDPEKVYYGFRAPEELKKAVSTFSGVPLQLDHHPDSADDPQKQARVGTIGTDAAWMDPYVVASLCVWDADAIDAIESGRMKELSCAYRYDPDFTPGTYDGQRYDFIMRNIRGNHVALVEEGRAGPDVVVADTNTVIMNGKMARDDRWITVHPNGANHTGRPALIDEKGTVKAGMGGKFNGRNIDDVPRSKNPHPVTKEKYQARQERQAQKQKVSSSPLDVSKLSDQEIDDRMSSVGKAWYRATDAEKEEYYAIKREFDKRREEKNADLNRKRDERLASPEYQAELKRREEAAARRDHVREREREITSSTYERAQAKLRKPFDDRLKRQLGNKGQAHDVAFEEGRAGQDVIADSQTVKECSMEENMMQDGDPAIEQKEVDLAQAIIDLHRVDPMTGQLVDVAEDEDKNAEIRRLMDELSAAMTPEQAQKLHSALSDLAYSTPTGDAEGSNAEFAEGVKYGEKLERDPDERRRLDREHESEGMRKAMDECGLDADDPASSKAFAEGVKYGEKLIGSPEEREKLDREHEREGMEKKYGMDAATVRREATAAVRRQMKALSDAARKVRPLCGEIDPFAFDSAQDIYRHAIESRGRDASRYQPAAWEGMVDVLLERPMAADSAPVFTKGTMLPHLDRFVR